MKYALPIFLICVVAQRWVPGMAGVGGLVFLGAIYHGLRKTEKGVRP